MPDIPSSQVVPDNVASDNVAPDNPPMSPMWNALEKVVNTLEELETPEQQHRVLRAAQILTCGSHSK